MGIQDYDVALSVGFLCVAGAGLILACFRAIGVERNYTLGMADKVERFGAWVRVAGWLLMVAVAAWLHAWR